MHIKDYIKLYKLAKSRNKSEMDYFNFEKFQAEIVIKSLKRKNIVLKGARVLDIGSGRGGYSYVLTKNGAHVVSLDLDRKKFTAGNKPLSLSLTTSVVLLHLQQLLLPLGLSH